MNNFLRLQSSQQRNLLLIAGKLIGSLQNHGLIFQNRMVDDGPEGIQAQAACSQTFMTVLVAGEGILAVVYMQGTELVQSENTVEFRKNTVQITHDIIASVINMAGIQTDTHIVASYSIDDGLQFLKFSTHFASLASHGLQQDFDRIIMAQGIFQRRGNIFDASFCSLSHMAARMEIVKITWQSSHTPQIILQDFCRKGTGFRIRSTQIHGIGTVGDQGRKAMFLQHGNRLCRVRRILRFCLAAPGIPGKEGKGIGPDGQSRFYHGGIAAGC